MVFFHNMSLITNIFMAGGNKLHLNRRGKVGVMFKNIKISLKKNVNSVYKSNYFPTACVSIKAIDLFAAVIYFIFISAAFQFMQHD